jgi:glycosyltransferase involved in cell wall biosynthesis
MRNKVIHVLANDGSPLGVTMNSIWGKDGRFGVGGAELAILTLCEGWHNRGYDVTFYNNPSEGGVGPFKQKTLDEFNPLDDRDFLVIFRSPNERIYEAKGKRIWFSTDQQTVGNFKEFAKRVDKIVTISPHHADHFKAFYGIVDTITIDLPVRDDYNKPVEKISKRCIYTSIPDRGVMQLNAAWPLIVREVPDASLVITSDWRLWNPDIDRSILTPYQLPFARQPNVSYVGAVKREKLIQYQLEADLLLFPCVYEELFCITVAEAQVAGAIPITSQFGSLPTTNQFGVQIEGSPYEPKFIETFVETAVYFLRDKNLREKQEEMKRLARERFALDKILDEWDERVFA